MNGESNRTKGITRRDFFLHMGAALGMTSLGTLIPELLRVPGLHSRALALSADIVLDTFNAVAAMTWPGSDEYSLAQGESTNSPGAVAANTGVYTIEFFNRFFPAPDDAGENDFSAPLAEMATVLINDAALQVNPVAAGGALLAPFARLSYAEKQQAWAALEDDPALGLLFTQIPTIVAMLAFSERDVLDQASGQLGDRPLGWEHSGFQQGRLQPLNGWDDHLGYYLGRREADS